MAIRVMTIALCLAASLLTVCLCRMYQKGDFGWDTVACVFLLIACCALLLVACEILMGLAGAALTVTGVLFRLLCIITGPLLLLSVLGILSGMLLIKEQGPYLANAASIVASLTWLAAQYMAFVATESISATSVVTVAIFAVQVLVNLFILTAFACNWLAALHVPKAPVDYLIILGCGLWEDGTPAPILRKRIDRALLFDRLQQELGFEGPIFVASGGQGEDEPLSEAESIRIYLEKSGIQEERILVESRSSSTYENLAFSRQVVQSHSNLPLERLRIAFVTTNYHVLRTHIMARNMGIRLEGMASPTTFRFWPKGFLREMLATLKP